MGKIAIVGVEGSGKTVLMAALGAAYEHPDENGMFLTPKNQDAFKFSMSYMHLMRNRQQWPSATMTDSLRYLEWELRTRDEIVAELSLLDYAGEIYRRAFSENGDGQQYAAEMEALLQHITEASTLLVLINLRDVIDGDRSSARTLETLWLNKSILEFASKVPTITNIAIILTQADKYRNAIEQCGGPGKTLEKYLPFVMNIYHDIPVFAVSAVDRTEPDENGIPLPAKDFQSQGIKDIIFWLTRTKKIDKIEKAPLNMEDNSVVKSLDMLSVPSSTQESNDSFWISKNMITRDQWAMVMEPGKRYHDNAPVVNVSRDQALAFCNRLNQMQKRTDGYFYSLPTSVQWKNSLYLRKQNGESAPPDLSEWCADISHRDSKKTLIPCAFFSFLTISLVLLIIEVTIGCGGVLAGGVGVLFCIFIAFAHDPGFIGNIYYLMYKKLQKHKYVLASSRGRYMEEAGGEKALRLITGSKKVEDYAAFSDAASSCHSKNIGFRAVLTKRTS